MLRRISPPLTLEAKLEVVSVADLQAHARISYIDEDEDGVIRDVIGAAFDYLSGPDGWLNGCCLLEEEFELLTAGVGRHPVSLEARPFATSTLVSMAMLTESGAYEDVPPSRYRVGYGAFYASVSAAHGSLLPATAYRRDPEAFRVRFCAGFATAQDVPSDLKLAIKMLAAHWYANREATSSDNRAVPTKVELGLKALCRRHRLALDHS